VIPKGLKSEKHIRRDGNHVFLLPLFSTKQRLHSLNSHHETFQIFIIWHGRSDPRWERSSGSSILSRSQAASIKFRSLHLRPCLGTKFLKTTVFEILYYTLVMIIP
jgi:hypothetical protein